MRQMEDLRGDWLVNNELKDEGGLLYLENRRGFYYHSESNV